MTEDDNADSLDEDESTTIAPNGPDARPDATLEDLKALHATVI